MDTSSLWFFMMYGYLITVAIEIPILLVGLSSRHSIAKKCLAGLWLTACTYPIVVLVLPILIWRPWGYTVYIIIAEIFAPLAECLLFNAIDKAQESNLAALKIRDSLVIVIANLSSLTIGYWIDL